MDIFQVLFYVPLFNLLMFITNNLGSIGLAIIIVAAVSKLITYPLTRGQIEQASKNKELQSQIKAVQKKYKYNQEVLTKELAKVQAKALPGQLKGCLSLIVFIVFFFQIRGTIVDLVNRGYHAFNTVAYSESLKKKEDSIKFNLPNNSLPQGKNNITIHLVSSDNKILDKVIYFEVVSDVPKRIEEIKNEELNKSENQRKAEADDVAKRYQLERSSDIAVYNKKFETGLHSIAFKSFLIFPTESVQRLLITDNTANFEFYMRPPSGETLVASSAVVTLNGVNITSQAQITQGDKFNLEFLGMNLAKVATDFDITNFSITGPYIVLALISAFTQYGVTKIYSATNVATAPTDEKKKELPKDKEKGKGKDNGKDKAEDQDMGAAMAQSMQATNKIIPIFTFILSLGYLGGASVLPTGVTLFWTAQNAFVIIQQSFMNRKQIGEKLKKRFQFGQTVSLKVKTDKNGSK